MRQQCHVYRRFALEDRHLYRVMFGAERTFTECLARISLGFGDRADLVEQSLRKARRRARRAAEVDHRQN